MLTQQPDWASYERTLRWVKGPIHPTLVEKASAVFDFPAQAPVIRMGPLHLLHVILTLSDREFRSLHPLERRCHPNRRRPTHRARLLLLAP